MKGCNRGGGMKTYVSGNILLPILGAGYFFVGPFGWIIFLKLPELIFIKSCVCVWGGGRSTTTYMYSSSWHMHVFKEYIKWPFLRRKILDANSHFGSIYM